MMPWRLDCGDCVAGLADSPDDEFDVCVMDPPYSEHVHSNGKSSKLAKTGEISTDYDMGFAAISAELVGKIAPQIVRTCKRWILVFGDIEGAPLWRDNFVAAGAEYIRTGIWLRTGAPQFSGDRPAVGFEAITICHRPGKKKWNGGGTFAVWDYPNVRGGEQRVHPTQKPVGLMEKLVSLFSDPGELICDPFAGSGSTGVAAIRNGRRFVGWEMNAEYAEAARKRLNCAKEQLQMFDGAGI
jgi:site-specific DNA-methyltransferase (adenine-specific)